jgi:hypothetical protein
VTQAMINISGFDRTTARVVLSSLRSLQQTDVVSGTLEYVYVCVHMCVYVHVCLSMCVRMYVCIRTHACMLV